MITQDYSQPNSIEVIFWNSTLFTRVKDGQQISSGTSISESLPKFIESSIQSIIKVIGVTVNETGKRSLTIMFFANIFMKFAMNQILSQVQN